MPSMTATRPAASRATAKPCCTAWSTSGPAATRWSCRTRAARATSATTCASSTARPCASPSRPARSMRRRSTPSSGRSRRPSSTPTRGRWRPGARRTRRCCAPRRSRSSGCATGPRWPNGNTTRSIRTTVWSRPNWSAAGKRRCATCGRPRRRWTRRVRGSAKPPFRSDGLRAAFTDASRRLPELLHGSALTTARKKALLRCLIDKLVIHRSAPDTIRMRLVWRGGDASALDIPVAVGSLAALSRHAELEARILELAREGQGDAAIAAALTADGHRSPMRDRVLPSTVRSIRLLHGILLKRSQSHPRRLPGHLTISQLAARLGVSASWIYDRVHNGTIAITRDERTGLYLFPDAPGTLDQLRRLRAGELDQIAFGTELGS